MDTAPHLSYWHPTEIKGSLASRIDEFALVDIANVSRHRLFQNTKDCARAEAIVDGIRNNCRSLALVGLHPIAQGHQTSAGGRKE
jgi:hypothetical protein